MGVIAKALGSLLPRAERERLARLSFRDAGHGYDLLGLSPKAVAGAAAVLGPFYDRYFRVDSRGAERVPSQGGAILAVNHSGVLPVDAALLWLDVLRHTDPPRAPRVVADLFVPLLPMFGTAASRAGVVAGELGNCERLLEDGELLMVFPEGVPGVAKPFSERYQLRPFRVGHAQLALRERVPVVPVAVVGAEEAWPLAARLPWPRLFGAPYFPVPLVPLPLPLRIHLRYGAPLFLHRQFPQGSAEDPVVATEAAGLVQAAVAALIATARAERGGRLW